MVVVASDSQHVTGSNHSGILIFFPVNIFVKGRGRYVEHFALDTVSKFSHLVWEISPVNNKKSGTVM
jgi:hypothetical protein